MEAREVGGPVLEILILKMWFGALLWTNILMFVVPIIVIVGVLMFSRVARVFLGEVIRHPFRTSRIERSGRRDLKVQRSKRPVHL